MLAMEPVPGTLPMQAQRTLALDASSVPAPAQITELNFLHFPTYQAN